MSKLMVTQKKIVKNVVKGYKTIEGGVVSIPVLRQQLSYKKISETLVPNSASLITFPYRFVGTFSKLLYYPVRFSAAPLFFRPSAASAVNPQAIRNPGTSDTAACRDFVSILGRKKTFLV